MNCPHILEVNIATAVVVIIFLLAFSDWRFEDDDKDTTDKEKENGD